MIGVKVSWLRHLAWHDRSIPMNPNGPAVRAEVKLQVFVGVLGLRGLGVWIPGPPRFHEDFARALLEV